MYCVAHGCYRHKVNPMKHLQEGKSQGRREEATSVYLGYVSIVYFIPTPICTDKKIQLFFLQCSHSSQLDKMRKTELLSSDAT